MGDFCRRAAAFSLASLVGLAALTAQSSAEPAILVSRQLARDANLRVGDIVQLAADPSGPRAGKFRIAGIYEPTPDPAKFTLERFEARLHLPDLIDLTADPADPQSAEAISAINISLADPSNTERFAAGLSSRGVGVIGRPTSRAREGDPFAVLERFHMAIAAVTIVGSSAFLLALMIIRAEERRETVGMLRLIGISRRSIVLEIVAESVVVAIAGAVFGVLLAVAAQYGINRFFQARYDTALIFVKVTPSIAIRCLAVALPVGIMTGAAASWTLLRRVPAALVRR